MSTVDYRQFLADKAITSPLSGVTFEPVLREHLFPFQRDIVRWALKRGRAAIFADCGMGKTPMQLEWARVVAETQGPVLILAPLAVAQQTVRECEKFYTDMSVYYHRAMPEVTRGITITNYEMLQHFDPSKFAGIVLDESSILKAYDGKTRTAIIEAFAQTPYRLACTATPAPNDYMELGNHAQFVGSMSRVEMLSMFFVHDGGETQQWRLKGHAEQDFWRWLASWAVMIRKPSDLGYDDGAFILPKLSLHEHVMHVEKATDGYLFALEAVTLQDRIAARRESVVDRVAECAALVNTSDQPWVVWCNLNSESEALRKAIPDAIEIRGSQSNEDKEAAILAFLDGSARVLITKASMSGFGLNLQHCAHMAFVGLSDSWEQFYQAIRRCYRFGQVREVNAHLIIASTEGAVLKNIKDKDTAAGVMAESIVNHMRAEMRANIQTGTVRHMNQYEREVVGGDHYAMHLGDCVEVVKDLAPDSIHYSIFSPPFASLYTYSASDRDMGNCRDQDDFLTHFGFLVRDLYRVTMPGRLLSFHCMNIPTTKTHHGYIGIQDFRGDLIRLFEAVGFIFHSEVCIWKDPVTAMQRTKALGLLYKQLKKDSAMSRQGIPDYLVTMCKPGENPERVTHTAEDFPVGVWQNYASPVWMDIAPSDTLQFRSAREENDERHICPLQLGVIQRGIELWTNPGDTVLSPFAGIGSEGYVALQNGRRFIGVELKRSYWQQACENLRQAKRVMGDLFDVA
jgi:superfamily II DNA or RNA helicase